MDRQCRGKTAMSTRRHVKPRMRDVRINRDRDLESVFTPRHRSRAAR